MFPEIIARRPSSPTWHKPLENSFNEYRKQSQDILYNKPNFEKIFHSRNSDISEPPKHTKHTRNMSLQKPIFNSNADINKIEQKHNINPTILIKRPQDRYNNRNNAQISLNIMLNSFNYKEPQKIDLKVEANINNATSIFKEKPKWKHDAFDIQDSRFIPNQRGKSITYYGHRRSPDSKDDSLFLKNLEVNSEKIDRDFLYKKEQKLDHLVKDNSLNLFPNINVSTDESKHSLYYKEKDIQILNDSIRLLVKKNLINNHDGPKYHQSVVKNVHEIIPKVIPFKHFNLIYYKNNILNKRKASQTSIKDTNLERTDEISKIINKKANMSCKDIIMESRLEDQNEQNKILLKDRYARSPSSAQTSYNINRLKDSNDFSKLDLSGLQREGWDLEGEKVNFKKFVNRINHVKDVTKIKLLHAIKNYDKLKKY